VVVSQAQTFKEDFEQERKDRENEHGKAVEIEERYKHQVESMVKQLSETARDLQNHKETLATTETVMHSKLEQLSDLLCEKNLEMAAIVAKNDHLQEEVLSKTQQVEQYKKQVDQYKQEVGALKQSAQMEVQQVHTCITAKKILTVVSQKSTPYLLWHNLLYRVKAYSNEHLPVSQDTIGQSRISVGSSALKWWKTQHSCRFACQFAHCWPSCGPEASRNQCFHHC